MSILNDAQITELCIPPRFYDTRLSSIAAGFGVLTTHEKLITKGYSWFNDEQYFTQKLTEEEREQIPFNPMISPFVERQVKTVDDKKIVSYGLSSFGYDVRLGNKFKIFTNIKNALIDPLAPSEDMYVEHEGDYCIIPPNSYVLGHTMEYFDIPRDVVVIAVGKSTYARLAAIVNVTPIEPGFKGEVVIEIANNSPLPLKVYAGMGIAQFMFFRGEPCMVSYADRGGKYQGQTGVTTARL